jgi:hypothetical protein
VTSLFVYYARKDVEIVRKRTEPFNNQELNYWIDWEGDLCSFSHAARADAVRVLHGKQARFTMGKVNGEDKFLK